VNADSIVIICVCGTEWKHCWRGDRSRRRRPLLRSTCLWLNFCSLSQTLISSRFENTSVFACS